MVYGPIAASRTGCGFTIIYFHHRPIPFVFTGVFFHTTAFAFLGAWAALKNTNILAHSPPPCWLKSAGLASLQSCFTLLGHDSKTAGHSIPTAQRDSLFYKFLVKENGQKNGPKKDKQYSQEHFYPNLFFRFVNRYQASGEHKTCQPKVHFNFSLISTRTTPHLSLYQLRGLTGDMS